MHLRDLFPCSPLLGAPTIAQGLGVMPLLAGEDPDPLGLALLDEALEAGDVKISETSEMGEVPFLKLENGGERPVLILEGEELVGGKQNRVVNATIIVPAGNILKIPVSCMEAGRWDRRQEDFNSGKAIFRAKSRAVQKASVTASIRERGTFRSDQGAVWDEVSASLDEFAAPSPSSDFRASRDKLTERIEKLVTAFRPVESQIGAIFTSSVGILGMESLATPDLFQRSAEKIVRSFAFEVLSAPDLENVGTDHVDDWWNKVLDAPLSRHPSLGVGEDIRIDSQDFIGSGLRWNSTLIHFSCFPGLAEAQTSNRPSTHRLSASQRRNRMGR
jgi:hypothetical protein